MWYHVTYEIARKVLDTIVEKNREDMIKREELYKMKAIRIEQCKEKKVKQLKEFSEKKAKEETIKKKHQMEELQRSSDRININQYELEREIMFKINKKSSIPVYYKNIIGFELNKYVI